MLPVYDVTHSLALGGEDETRRHFSYLLWYFYRVVFYTSYLLNTDETIDEKSVGLVMGDDLMSDISQTSNSLRQDFIYPVTTSCSIMAF